MLNSLLRLFELGPGMLCLRPTTRAEYLSYTVTAYLTRKWQTTSAYGVVKHKDMTPAWFYKPIAI